jgi:hypothetical protein
MTQLCPDSSLPRWRRGPPVGLLLRLQYGVPALRAAWQAVRWGAAARLRRALRPAPPYRWSDFEFVTGGLSDSLWLCAILRPAGDATRRSALRGRAGHREATTPDYTRGQVQRGPLRAP